MFFMIEMLVCFMYNVLLYHFCLFCIIVTKLSLEAARNSLYRNRNWGVIFQIHHMIEKIWWWGMIANRLKSPNDIWRLKIKKWADMEATYMTLCCHILCKNGVLFCIIQHLLFGFCSSQCSIYVVKFSKTHTMVVHFSGCSGEKENWEHHHPGALKLVARGYQRKLDFSPCLSLLMLHVVFDQHINSPHHQLSQSDWQGFP